MCSHTFFVSTASLYYILGTRVNSVKLFSIFHNGRLPNKVTAALNNIICNSQNRAASCKYDGTKIAAANALNS